MPDLSSMYENLTAVLQEFQYKLGPVSLPMTLYYPSQALANLLDVPAEEEPLSAALNAFAAFAAPTLGPITWSRDGVGYTLVTPAEAQAWVRDHLPENPFLRELVSLVRGGASLEQVIELFWRYDPQTVCRRITGNPEFSMLMYFPSGRPDAFRYCFQEELDGDVTYHRFTEKEYRAFGFTEA